MKYKFKQEFSIGDEWGNYETKCDVQLYINENNISKSKITDMVYQMSLGFSELLEEDEQNVENYKKPQIDWNEVVTENNKATWFDWFTKKNRRSLL